MPSYLSGVNEEPPGVRTCLNSEAGAVEAVFRITISLPELSAVRVRLAEMVMIGPNAAFPVAVVPSRLELCRLPLLTSMEMFTSL